MSRQDVAAFNFTNGEASPYLQGRIDTSLNTSTCKAMRNFIPGQQGAASYRLGSEFKGYTHTQGGARNIPFVYDENNIYMLELSDEKMIVRRSAGLVDPTARTTLTVQYLTKGNPTYIMRAGSTGYQEGEMWLDDFEDTIPELNGGPYHYYYEPAGPYGLTYALEVDSTNMEGSYPTDGSGAATCDIAYVINAPWAIEDVPDLQFTQIFDVIYVVHPNYPPQYIKRNDETDWEIDAISFTGAPSEWATGNYPSVISIYEQRLWLGATPNEPQTIWGSKTGIYTTFTQGTSADDGLEFIVDSKNGTGISSITDSEEGLLIATGSGSRLMSGGQSAITPSNVQVKTLDSVGFATIVPKTYEKNILFVESGRKKVRALDYRNSDLEGVYSKDLNIIHNTIINSPIKDIAIQRGESTIIWVLLESGKLKGISFNSTENITGWFHYDLRAGDTVESIEILPRSFGEDELWLITKRSVNGESKYMVEIAELPTEVPDFSDYVTGDKEVDLESYYLDLFEAQKTLVHLDCSRIYDGRSYGLDAEASLTLDDTTGSITITSDADVFTSDMVGRQVWAYGQNGKAEITAYTSATEVEANVIVDFDNTSHETGFWYLTASTLYGLYHLDTETVSVLADGGLIANQTITDGKIELDFQVSYAVVGLPFDGTLILNELEGGNKFGISQGKKKNITSVSIRMLNTLGLKYGTDFYRLQEIEFRNRASYLNRPPALFTGDILLNNFDSWANGKNLIIKQENPYPCNVLLVAAEMKVSE